MSVKFIYSLLAICIYNIYKHVPNPTMDRRVIDKKTNQSVIIISGIRYRSEPSSYPALLKLPLCIEMCVRYLMVDLTAYILSRRRYTCMLLSVGMKGTTAIPIRPRLVYLYSLYLFVSMVG